MNVNLQSFLNRRAVFFTVYCHRLLARPPYSLSSRLSILQEHASPSCLPEARELHGLLVTSGLLYSSPAVLTSLISLYSKCSSPTAALAAFRSSPTPPNLFAWNAALSALSSNSLPEDALGLFRALRTMPALAPDRFTFPCIVKALSDLHDAVELRKIHALLFKYGLESEIFVSSAAVNAYLTMGYVIDAEKVFEKLPERDVVLWNSMVNGFAQKGQFVEAKQYFDRMLEQGMVPSRFTITGILSVFTSTADLNCGRKIHAFVFKMGYTFDVAISNSLIDLYGKCHSLEEAEQIFECMLERDIFSWNSMISALEYSAENVKALHLFGQMLHAGVQPDSITLAAILPACSQVAALSHGRETHAFLLRHWIKGDVFADNALMDMYAKCGLLQEARKVFEGMPKRDVASWNIMIDAYASHGQGEDALRLFSSMKSAADDVTLVAVLSACSHSGLVQAGLEVFARIEDGHFGVSPAAEHYLCMVDMLSRAGMLERAKEMAGMAEKAVGARGWRPYMAACKERGEVVMAVDAAERILGREQEGSGDWVLTANAYGWAGKFREVAYVRGEMRRRG
ncbi:hypothetical protein HPP92_018432 [Vanilla planifolia]|uniref:Pentatricopeptide repeat-containing protein n=1 Tax=Vanilla planifolia TaxID=51239 RepID=A0A835Q6V3_VANPL|nr:hypothetical protein HPP92_019045 [Vanilla planifolia]KAG0469104.1 hypothetical protein HPP92_018432 [Vanilla planifolia]